MISVFYNDVCSAKREFSLSVIFMPFVVTYNPLPQRHIKYRIFILEELEP